MKNIQLVSFDLFDTLVHYERAPWIFFIARMLLTSKVSYEQFRIVTQDSVTTNQSLEDVLRQKLNFSDGLIKAFKRNMGWEISTLRCFDDILILKKLQDSGYEIAITSNLAKDFWAPASKLLPIKPDHTFLSFEIGSRKPEKRIFRHILETTGYRPEQILHIGDKIRNDYAVPLKMGMHALRLDRKLTGDNSHHISTLQELEMLLLL